MEAKDLRRLRKLSGLTLYQLAARTRVPSTTIHRLETGSSEPRHLDVVPKLCRELRMAIEARAKECVSVLEDLLSEQVPANVPAENDTVN